MLNAEGPYSEYRQVLWDPRKGGNPSSQNPAIGSGYEIRHIPFSRRYYPVGSISLSEPPYTLQQYESPDTQERFQYCSKVFDSSGYSVETSMVHHGKRISDFSLTRRRVIGSGTTEHLTIRPRYIIDDPNNSDDRDDIFSRDTGVLLTGDDRLLSDLDLILDYTITGNDIPFSLFSVPLSYSDNNRKIGFPTYGCVMELQEKRIVGNLIAADTRQFTFDRGEWFPMGPYTVCCDPDSDKFHFQEVPSLSFPSVTLHIPPVHWNGHLEELSKIVLQNPIKRPDMTERFFQKWNAKIESSAY